MQLYVIFFFLTFFFTVLFLKFSGFLYFLTCFPGRNQGLDGGLVTKLCLTLATPWTVACQGPLSMGFSRQEYWSGMSFPSPQDLSQPDIMECEVKWILGSITMNKARGGDGIPVELFQILKDNAVKVLHSITHQIWKTQQWLHGLYRVSFHSNP